MNMYLSIRSDKVTIKWVTNLLGSHWFN